jgi:hypothetical protein
MERLGRFSRLPTTEQWLLIKAALLVEAIKLGMWLLPFRTLRRLLARAADTPLRVRRAERTTSAERVAWAVEVASRHTPGIKTCLAQALAAQVLLARRGHPALLHIGVARGDRGQFEAHAWVESEGRIMIGGSELERFAPLPVTETEA